MSDNKSTWLVGVGNSVLRASIAAAMKSGYAGHLLVTQAIERETLKAKFWCVATPLGWSERQINVIYHLALRGHQHSATSPYHYFMLRLERAYSLLCIGRCYRDILWHLWESRSKL